MLYVFIGNDTTQAKHTARIRATENEVVFIGEGGISYNDAPQYINVSGMFGAPPVLILDRPFDTAEGKHFISEHGSALHKNTLMALLITPRLSASDKKLLPRGVKTEMFDVAGSPEPVRPNVFAFTDTFLSGDRKKAWIGYRKLLASGISPEEIHGAMMWAVRSVLLAGKTTSANEAGLKPFVFSKSKRVYDTRGATCMEDVSRKLVSVYHAARSGQGSLELGIEDAILEKRY